METLTANSCLKTFLCITFFQGQTRQNLPGPANLDLLFNFTVRTVHFVAAHGRDFGDTEGHSLLEGLGKLIVRTLSALRNYAEITHFGRTFCYQILSNISERLANMRPIAAARRFFKYMQDVDNFLRAPRPQAALHLELEFLGVSFPTDARIRRQFAARGAPLVRSLIRFRDARGLPVRVNRTRREHFPLQNIVRTPLYLQNPYNQQMQLDLFRFT